MTDLAKEVWVVSNCNGQDFVTEFGEIAMDHASKLQVIFQNSDLG